MARIPYSRVYNRAFRVGPDRLNRWIQLSISRTRTLHTRHQWTTHVLTLARTQRLGSKIHPDTLSMVRATRALVFVGVLARLRHLQLRILRHLWRPGGALMRRHMPEAWLRPTPAAGAASAAP